MAEEKVKLIPFSKDLENAIEADAKRCRRSFVRQVEAVLMTYYQIENVEVNRERLQMMSEQTKVNNQPKVEILGEIDPKGGEDLPHFTIDLRDKKKKSA